MDEEKQSKAIFGRRDVVLFAAGLLTYSIGNDAVYLGAALMAASVFDFLGGKIARHRDRQMLSLLGMIVCAIGLIAFSMVYFKPKIFGTFESTAAPSGTTASSDAVAQLAALGWTIKPDPTSTQFQISSAPLPDMQQSAVLFKQYAKPFNIQLQSVPSLDGLHYLSSLTNCTGIQIAAGDFTDISELSGYTHLKSLEMSQIPLNATGIVDLTPLSGLINLTNLVLSSVNTRSIAPISGLPNIKRLYLGGTPVTDISALVGFKHLEYLSVWSTRVTDLTPIENDQALKELMIGGLQTPALSSLRHLQNLKMLQILDQQPYGLSQVADLPNLETLIVSMGVSPIDLDPVGNLTNLHILSISAFAMLRLTAPAYHAEVIGNLHDLNDLTLGGLQVSDLSFVSSLQNLTKLSLINLPISSLSFLQNLQHLHSVYLCDIQITDVTPLLALPALTSLRLLRVPARSDVLTALAKQGVTVKNF